MNQYEDYVDGYNVGLADGILDAHFMNAMQVIERQVRIWAQMQYEKYRKIIDLLLNMKEDAE